MSSETVSPLGMKFISEFKRHTDMFSEEGSIPLDTLGWLSCCLGCCFGIIDMEKMNDYYEEILNFALSHHQKYDFRLKFDEEDCHGPNKVWLMYKFKPECQI
jgi:hypothetical protein